MTHATKVKRQQKAKEMLAWLSQQPGQAVPLENFINNGLGRGDAYSILSHRGFAVYFEQGEQWVCTRERYALRKQAILQKAMEWLSIQLDQMALKTEFEAKVKELGERETLANDAYFVVFKYQEQEWIHPKDLHTAQFVSALKEHEKKQNDTAWKACRLLCGKVVRENASTSNTDRLYVTARTYTVEAAVKRLHLAEAILSEAIQAKDLSAFIDPEGRTRIPAEVVEAVLHDPAAMDKICQHATVKPRQIALVSGISYPAIRGRLKKAGFSTTEPKWKDVRGLWGLPNRLDEFKQIFEERYPAWLESVQQKEAELNSLAQAGPKENFRNERAETRKLRQQLLNVFPTWENTNRDEQQIILHLGPTNSGKTFHGLNNLIAAGSGWYLSPLRLLAHEVYDTLNRRGIPCNLLTGEEVAHVEGANITAATIEMLASHRSGRCVIIDEAHMLSDPQRGWAWTRALMENNAPQIHVIGSPIARSLVTRLAGELGVQIEIENYERLTPLEVSTQAWAMNSLPKRTILVAFSRKMVLGLKTELESKYHRSVSVVYGNLPPEVRLRQAERFANGDTEICVATDAIGMGLNLPADNVCFYETQKFDGDRVRTLTANEIKQIGGRAGRYGLSDFGLVGALDAEDLKIIKNAIHRTDEDLGFAYVAPTPESIALIPGSLPEKLLGWMELNGIPEKWKGILKPVDLTEQIALAKMLSPKDVDKLGEEQALELINAPCANNTELYWLNCARAILKGERIPPSAVVMSKQIQSSADLEKYEFAIRCADIYLWLSQRKGFSRFAPEVDSVRAHRQRWTLEVDAALVRKVDTARRCSSCGRSLPLVYQYNICQRCFRNRQYGHA
jgi:hypothetical protein